MNQRAIHDQVRINGSHTEEQLGMKRAFTILACMILAGTIAACGSKITPVSASDAQPIEIALESTAVPTATEPAATAQPSDDNQQVYAAFQGALENLMQNRILPDGMPSDEQDSANPSSFAVYDVDGDGQDELILLNNTATMAGTSGYVFDYEEGTEGLQTELLAYTDLTFYDNGIVQAKWSHNQGLAGDTFWPYSLFQYDASIDCYRPYYNVDAWDKACGETNGDGQPFPTEVDKSGVGIVYFISEGNGNDLSHPVDQSEYTAWLNQMIGSANVLPLQYFDLTKENVALLRSMH